MNSGMVSLSWEEKMKTITTNKMSQVAAPANSEGVIAYQLVEFVINFYGSETVDVLDTKIMADGRQIVIEGNGLIKAGYEIN
jgi:hypothetical protein